MSFALVTEWWAFPLLYMYRGSFFGFELGMDRLLARSMCGKNVKTKIGDVNTIS